MSHLTLGPACQRPIPDGGYHGLGSIDLTCHTQSELIKTTLPYVRRESLLSDKIVGIGEVFLCFPQVSFNGLLFLSYATEVQFPASLAPPFLSAAFRVPSLVCSGATRAISER